MVGCVWAKCSAEPLVEVLMAVEGLYHLLIEGVSNRPLHLAVIIKSGVEPDVPTDKLCCKPVAELCRAKIEESRCRHH